MNDFYTLPLERKRLILSSAETKIGLPAAAIEKDLWVTCVLQLLFSMDIHAEFLFKGGTSLSKAGNLIQRFSEDIDIAINPAVLGFSGDLTKKQIKRLRKASSLFVEQTLAVKLREVAIVQTSFVITRRVFKSQGDLLFLILLPVALGMEIRAVSSVAL